MEDSVHYSEICGRIHENCTMLDLIKYKYFRDTTQRTLIDFSIPQITDCLRESS